MSDDFRAGGGGIILMISSLTLLLVLLTLVVIAIKGEQAANRMICGVAALVISLPMVISSTARNIIFRLWTVILIGILMLIILAFVGMAVYVLFQLK